MLKTLCVSCGFDVAIDEDGCCAHCGADSIGDGADDAHSFRDKLTKLEASRDAWREAAEVGDCPPCCSSSRGCNADRCDLNEALAKARALDEGEVKP